MESESESNLALDNKEIFTDCSEGMNIIINLINKFINIS